MYAYLVSKDKLRPVQTWNTYLSSTTLLLQPRGGVSHPHVVRSTGDCVLLRAGNVTLPCTEPSKPTHRAMVINGTDRRSLQLQRQLPPSRRSAARAARQLWPGRGRGRWSGAGAALGRALGTGADSSALGTLHRCNILRQFEGEGRKKEEKNPQRGTRQKHMFRAVPLPGLAGPGLPQPRPRAGGRRRQRLFAAGGSPGQPNTASACRPRGPARGEPGAGAGGRRAPPPGSRQSAGRAGRRTAQVGGRAGGGAEAALAAGTAPLRHWCGERGWESGAGRTAGRAHGGERGNGCPAAGERQWRRRRRCGGKRVPPRTPHLVLPRERLPGQGSPCGTGPGRAAPGTRAPAASVA